jgi:hypothetical protein
MQKISISSPTPSIAARKGLGLLGKRETLAVAYSHASQYVSIYLTYFLSKATCRLACQRFKLRTSINPVSINLNFCIIVANGKQEYS